MGIDEVEVGQNLKAPIKHVRHSELERFCKDSGFKSVCPICQQGILLVHRDLTENGNSELLEFDYCTLCGQRFIYDDIESLRKFDHESGAYKTMAVVRELIFGDTDPGPNRCVTASFGHRWRETGDVLKGGTVSACTHCGLLRIIGHDGTKKYLLGRRVDSEDK